jgi:hypothetical protein
MGVERLDDACPSRESSHNLAGADRITLSAKRAGAALTAHDNLMSSGKRLTRNRKRNVTRSDRPDPHQPLLSIFREA